MNGFQVGDTVRFKAAKKGTLIGPDTGTVVQVTKNKVRVLFPVRLFLWLLPSQITKVKNAV